MEANNPGKSGTKLSDFFSETVLELIEKAVSHAEKGTSGEIRVIIKMNYDKAFAGDLDGQALHDFTKYGLANTRDKTGVLILVVLEEKRFKILADSGIYEKVGKRYFEDTVIAMGILFAIGKFADGIIGTVAEIGSKLAFYFPKKIDDTDELPNKPILEEDGQ